MSQLSRDIIAALRREQKVELAGLSEAELRGISCEVADTPASADFFYALLEAQNPSTKSIAICLVKDACDPGVVIEIVRRLAMFTSLDAQWARDLQKAFLEHSSRRDLYPGSRAQSLLGALFLAQGRPSLLRRLQAYLLEIEHSEDGEYLRHVAKVVGLIVAHVADDDLLLALLELAEVPEAEDEATFALGLHALSKGLDAQDREVALEAFHRARDFMARALKASEGRQDAELYHQCLLILLDFQYGYQGDLLSERLADLCQMAFCYSAILLPTDRPLDRNSWLGATSLEAMRWAELGTRLAILDTKLIQNAWLHAARVIEEELLLVFQASMSILKRGSTGGIEALVRPRIVGSIQRNTFQLAVLEQWLSENRNSLSAATAVAICDEINKALVKSLYRDCDSGVSPATAAAIIDDADITSDTALSAKAELENAIAAVQLKRVEPIATDVFEQIHNELLGNRDYTGEARKFFIQVVYHTITFVASRESLTHTAVPGIDYLFNRSVQDPPFEADLHKDYYGYLQSTPLRELVHREANDVANGRADLYFMLGGIKTVAELKKVNEDYTLETLVHRFGLQATAYQRTNVTYCILMVLDLVDRGGGSDHLRNLVGVYQKKSSSGNTSYSVVAFRVQGRRKTPSRLT